ncbi:hypothetical protein MAR_025651 [Mya arenaria]|uniref:Uncharacterized protein n=1 Tax=Mya arenaria TaxID=6604 RepID=A0ABY7EWB3_MYAAR|nr:hypothetical protein MAR_025651 [Mya arenaria]
MEMIANSIVADLKKEIKKSAGFTMNGRKFPINDQHFPTATTASGFEISFAKAVFGNVVQAANDSGLLHYKLGFKEIMANQKFSLNLSCSGIFCAGNVFYKNIVIPLQLRLENEQMHGKMGVSVSADICATAEKGCNASADTGYVGNATVGLLNFMDTLPVPTTTAPTTKSVNVGVQSSASISLIVVIVFAQLCLGFVARLEKCYKPGTV